MKQARTARVNAARLREFGEDVLVQVATAQAVTVLGIRAQRDELETGPGAGSFEGVWVDPDALPAAVTEDGKSFVSIGGGAPMVVQRVSRPDPYGLAKLTLGRAR